MFSQCRHPLCGVVYWDTWSLLVFIATLGPCCCLLRHSVLVVYWDTRSLLVFIGTLGPCCCLLGHSVIGGVYCDTRSLGVFIGTLVVVVCLSLGLQDERAKYASLEELSIQYELPITNSEVRGHMTVM